MTKIELQLEKDEQMDRGMNDDYFKEIIKKSAMKKYQLFMNSCSDEEWEVLREEGLVNE